jgi:hypothetical protein
VAAPLRPPSQNADAGPGFEQLRLRDGLRLGAHVAFGRRLP